MERAEATEGEATVTFSRTHPWIGCPPRTVPLNSAWTVAEQRASAREFRARHRAVPSATLKLMSFCSNYERTCKYTALTFLPMALRLQFQRAANVYFLFIGTLYTFEAVSPVAGITRFGTLGALFVVLVASLASEGLQDLSRYRQDTKMNARPCQVITPAPNRARPRAPLLWPLTPPLPASCRGAGGGGGGISCRRRRGPVRAGVRRGDDTVPSAAGAGGR
jgi:hypothetical protein